MPVFERPPLDTLTPAKDRWTPIYLQYGRLEVDDSSVKWIGADYTVLRIPVATVSAILLGPGTTVTHAAIKACSDSNTPVCWVGAEGMRFYAFGVSPTHDVSRASRQAALHASKADRLRVARRMFAMRFGDQNLTGFSIDKLKGMEGKRVKSLYAEMGRKYGVSWKGRRYDQNHWALADEINRAISAANASLYALCTATICSMGYLPHLGFIHTKGMLSFVFDMADIYKPETTLEAAFQTVSVNPQANEQEVISCLKRFIEERRLLKRIPKDIEKILHGDS